MNEIPSTEQQQIIGEWMVSQIEQGDKRYCIEELKEVFFDDDSILEKVKTAAISTQMAVEILNRYFNLFITSGLLKPIKGTKYYRKLNKKEMKEIYTQYSKTIEIS